MKTNLLRAKMALANDTNNKLAECLDITVQSVIGKIKGHQDFKASEIAIIKNRYNLSLNEVNEIFFEGEN